MESTKGVEQSEPLLAAAFTNMRVREKERERKTSRETESEETQSIDRGLLRKKKAKDSLSLGKSFCLPRERKRERRGERDQKRVPGIVLPYQERRERRGEREQKRVRGTSFCLPRAFFLPAPSATQSRCQNRSCKALWRTGRRAIYRSFSTC